MNKTTNKTIINPVSGEKVTFISTSAESNGLKSVIEIELQPTGEGPPPHYHKAYTETFYILEGELSIQLGKELKILQTGETCTVNKYQQHTFRNDSSSAVKIQVTVKPGHEGFENALSILFGLSRDDLVTKTGAPKRIADLLVISKLADTHINGALSFISYALNFMISDKKLERRRTELLSKYCNIDMG